jgi:hypothetical protein
MLSVRGPALLCVTLVSLAAQSDVTPAVVQLSRIKQQMAEHLSHIANFTCLETIRRSRSDRFGQMLKSDTLRLEVAFVDGKELFSRHGADKFEDRGIGELVAGGAIESGLFASLARGVFLQKWPTYRYAGEEVLRGRRAVRYNYEVPLLGSGYELNIGGERALVGFSGSFWADAETLQVMRLSVNADDIPFRLRIVKAVQSIDYDRVRLNETDFLLPERAEMDLEELSGGKSRNQTEFSHWLRYVGESTLVFDDSTSKGAAAEESKLRLPAGLVLVTRLETEIGSDRALVGDRITATVEQDARSKQKLIVPAGATLEGRIRAIEKTADASGNSTLTLEFSELQIAGRRIRFFARLSEVKSSSGEARKITDEGLLGVAALQIRGSRFRLSHDLRLVWKMGEL